MADSPKVFLLGEDDCHLRFMYSWLCKRGLGSRDIRELPVAAGQGSGEKRVREQFPAQLAAIRAMRHRKRCWLIALTDADTLTVEERLRKLEPTDVSDPVSFIIPRRNIETWVRVLDESMDVDEETDYKLRAQDLSACKRAGKSLAEADGPSETWPPSLRRACSELRALLEAPGIF